MPLDAALLVEELREENAQLIGFLGVLEQAVAEGIDAVNYAIHMTPADYGKGEEGRGRLDRALAVMESALHGYRRHAGHARSPSVVASTGVNPPVSGTPVRTV
jgi:hypothetical protein